MIINIPGVHQPQQDSISIGDLEHQEDDSIKDLDMQNCLDYIQEHERPEVLKLAVSKTEPGGRIRFSGLDFILMGKLLYTCSVQSPSAVLFGGKQSISTAVKERVLVETLGLKMISQFINTDSYVIICEKPC